MALNVNIIGRDSEGNLQALKVNSEGNLEISGFSEWGESLQDISDKLDILVGKLEPAIKKFNYLALCGRKQVKITATAMATARYTAV